MATDDPRSRAAMIINDKGLGAITESPPFIPRHQAGAALRRPGVNRNFFLTNNRLTEADGSTKRLAGRTGRRRGSKRPKHASNGQRNSWPARRLGRRGGCGHFQRRGLAGHEPGCRGHERNGPVSISLLAAQPGESGAPSAPKSRTFPAFCAGRGVAPPGAVSRRTVIGIRGISGSSSPGHRGLPIRNPARSCANPVPQAKKPFPSVG